MEKTCADEKNGTTDMWVEKKEEKNGEVLRTEKSPMMC